MAHILLVDDDPQIRKVLGDFIRMSGHELTTASNGKEALDCLDTTAVDLMLLDIIMPEQDGIETIIKLNGREKRPAVIAMSGGSQRLDIDFIISIASKLPVAAVLAKPVSFEKLNEAINKALALPGLPPRNGNAEP